MFSHSVEKTISSIYVQLRRAKIIIVLRLGTPALKMLNQTIHNKKNVFKTKPPSDPRMIALDRAGRTRRIKAEAKNVETFVGDILLLPEPSRPTP